MATSFSYFTLDSFAAKYPRGAYDYAGKEIIIVIEGKVVDVTNFAHGHPGGYAILQKQHGGDASGPFKSMRHSSDAEAMVRKYTIGEIVQEGDPRLSLPGCSSGSNSGAGSSKSPTLTSASSPIQAGAQTTRRHTNSDSNTNQSLLDNQSIPEVKSSGGISAEQKREAFQTALHRTQYDNSTPTFASSLFPARGGVPPSLSGQADGQDDEGPVDLILHIIAARDLDTDDGCGISTGVRTAIEVQALENKKYQEGQLKQAEDGVTSASVNEFTQEEVDAALSAHRRQGYGSKWHSDRRRKILEGHPEIRKLVEEKHSFPLTLVLGFFASFLHSLVLLNWIPNLMRYVAGQDMLPRTIPVAWSALDWVWGVIVNSPLLLLHPPIVGGQEGRAGAGAEAGATIKAPSFHFGSFIMCIFLAFGYAYTIGAWCRMTAFAVGHEIAHEAVHKWISVNGTQASQKGKLYWLRFIVKDLCLRVSTLPSFGCTVFEYYHNQHLSHHQHLGSKEFGVNLRRLLDGSQSGDGDMMSVNTLLFKLRHLDHVRYTGLSPQQQAYQDAMALYRDHGDPRPLQVQMVAQMQREQASAERMQQQQAEAGSAKTSAEDRDEGGGSSIKIPSSTVSIHAAENMHPVQRAQMERTEEIANFFGTVEETKNAMNPPDAMAPSPTVEEAERLQKIRDGLMFRAAEHAGFTVAHGHLNPILKPRGVEFKMQAGRLDDQGMVGEARNHPTGLFVQRHPVLSKLLFDPMYHVGHHMMTVTGATVQIVGFPAWCAFVAGAMAPSCLKAKALKTFMALFPVLKSPAFKDKYYVAASSYWVAAREIWPQASVGLQLLLSIIINISLWHHACLANAVSEDVVYSHPGYAFFLIVIYASMSELFLFGWFFHPFMSYFLAVHQAHYEEGVVEEGGGGSARTTCQPTRSIYSTFLSVCTCNLNYHVEHHDFPSLPFWYLPQVRKLAPEFYSEKTTQTGKAQFFGCYEVIWKYLQSKEAFTYACGDVFTEESGAPPGTTVRFGHKADGEE